MADRRFVDHEGIQWDSKYESAVYWHLRGLGIPVRKCEKGGSDTFRYTSSVVRGRCMECQSGNVVQERTYTPDLYADMASSAHAGGYYVEAKGYWNAPKRNLLRSVVKANEDLRLLFIFQKDLWVTKGKTKYSDYIRRYFPGAECVIWDNTPRLLPGEKRGGKKGVRDIILPPGF